MTNFSANLNELYVRGNNLRILTNFIIGLNEQQCRIVATVHLGYLRTDISGIGQARFHLTHISYHSPSYHSRKLVCYLTCL